MKQKGRKSRGKRTYFFSFLLFFLLTHSSSLPLRRRGTDNSEAIAFNSGGEEASEAFYGAKKIK